MKLKCKILDTITQNEQEILDSIKNKYCFMVGVYGYPFENMTVKEKEEFSIKLNETILAIVESIGEENA